MFMFKFIMNSKKMSDGPSKGAKDFHRHLSKLTLCCLTEVNKNKRHRHKDLLTAYDLFGQGKWTSKNVAPELEQCQDKILVIHFQASPLHYIVLW